MSNSPDGRPARRRGGPVWSVSAGYGFYFAAIGCYFPYIVLYYRSLGLSGSEIGVLSAIPPLATAFLAPAWGLLADLRGIHRLILRAALVGSAAATLLLSRVTTFAPIVLLVAALALVAAPALSLLDSYGITVSAQQGLAYGRLRVWGSVGYVAAAWLVGWLMRGAVSNLFLVGYALTLACTALATIGLPALHERQSKRTWRGATALLRRPAIVVLLITTYLVSISTSAMYNFLGIYLTEMGGGTRLVGAANALAAVSELPVLLFGAALSSWLGSRRLLMVAMVVYIIRLLAYSVLPDPNWVLPVQLLHGLSFGANLMASVTLINQLAGSELAATGQGLLASSFAFGTITGSLVGGILLDRIALPMLFRLAALGAVLGLTVFLLGARTFAAEIEASPLQ